MAIRPTTLEVSELSLSSNSSSTPTQSPQVPHERQKMDSISLPEYTTGFLKDPSVRKDFVQGPKETPVSSIVNKQLVKANPLGPARANSDPQKVASMAKPVNPEKWVNASPQKDLSEKPPLDRSVSDKGEYAKSVRQLAVLGSFDLNKPSMIHFCMLPTSFLYSESDAEKAADQLTVCIKCYHGQFDEIMNFAVEIYMRAKSKVRLSRFYKVLAFLLSNPQNALFIYEFFKKTQDNFRLFVNQAVPLLFEKKKHFKLEEVLSILTAKDLETQTRYTCFRDACPSSYLGGAMGRVLWTEELKHFEKELVKELKKSDPNTLSLVRAKYGEKILKHHPELAESKVELGEKIDEELNKIYPRVSDFANRMLSKLYSLKIPEAFSELVIKRRAQIKEFLNSHPLEKETDAQHGELSRVYICELLMLRIVNPSIMQLEEKVNRRSDEQSARKSLSKIIELISGESPLSHKEEFGQKFSLLIKEFLPIHNKWVDAYSLKQTVKPSSNNNMELPTPS